MMLDLPRQSLIRLSAFTAIAALALVGCQTPPSTPSVPPSTLQLIAAEPMQLPASCEAEGSYFVSFTVLEDGRTGAIRTPPGDACLAEALSAWVASFRYAPPVRPVQTGVEWILVSGKRGS
jgi:hypothetical protein